MDRTLAVVVESRDGQHEPNQPAVVVESRDGQHEPNQPTFSVAYGELDVVRIDDLSIISVKGVAEALLALQEVNVEIGRKNWKKNDTVWKSYEEYCKKMAEARKSCSKIADYEIKHQRNLTELAILKDVVRRFINELDNICDGFRGMIVEILAREKVLDGKIKRARMCRILNCGFWTLLYGVLLYWAVVTAARGRPPRPGRVLPVIITAPFIFLGTAEWFTENINIIENKLNFTTAIHAAVSSVLSELEMMRVAAQELENWDVLIREESLMEKMNILYIRSYCCQSKIRNNRPNICHKFLRLI